MTTLAATSTDTLASLNPATGDIVGTVPVTPVNDIDRLVAQPAEGDESLLRGLEMALLDLAARRAGNNLSDFCSRHLTAYLPAEQSSECMHGRSPFTSNSLGLLHCLRIARLRQNSVDF